MYLIEEINIYQHNSIDGIIFMPRVLNAYNYSINFAFLSIYMVINAFLFFLVYYLLESKLK